MSKTILITGSTDGIGKLAATRLAKVGHDVILHGRNTEKLSRTIAEMKAISKNDRIDGLEADLSDLDSISHMVEQLKSKVASIDVLINNAGVYNTAEPRDKNGIDMRFVVNYLAPYLLTDRIVPLLLKGKNPRVINLSSAAQSPVSLDLLQGRSNGSEGITYSQSKLALTMWSFYLAELIPKISVIAVNPGSLLNTNMVKEAYGFHSSPAEKGAEILYELAISKDYDGLTGKYFDNDRGSFGNAHPDAVDSEKIKKLINQTDQILANY